MGQTDKKAPNPSLKDCRDFNMPNHTILTDDEAIRDITVILAAYSEKFPQLRGKAVRPDLKDDARKAFATRLVEYLNLSGTKLCREVRDETGPQFYGDRR